MLHITLKVFVILTQYMEYIISINMTISVNKIDNSRLTNTYLCSFKITILKLKLAITLYFTINTRLGIFQQSNKNLLTSDWLIFNLCPFQMTLSWNLMLPVALKVFYFKTKHWIYQIINKSISNYKNDNSLLTVI